MREKQNPVREKWNNVTLLTLGVTEITVRVNLSPPDLIKSTTCLCVAPSTLTPFLEKRLEQIERENVSTEEIEKKVSTEEIEKNVSTEEIERENVSTEKIENKNVSTHTSRIRSPFLIPAR